MRDQVLSLAGTVFIHVREFPRILIFALYEIVAEVQKRPKPAATHTDSAPRVVPTPLCARWLQPLRDAGPLHAARPRGGLGSLHHPPHFPHPRAGLSSALVSRVGLSAHCAGEEEPMGSLDDVLRQQFFLPIAVSFAAREVTEGAAQAL